MFATSTDILRSVRKDADLPDSTALDRLRDHLDVSLDPLIVSEDRYARVGDQIVLTFAATWSSAEQAAAIVTAWIAAFESGFAEVFFEQTTRSVSYFRQTLDQAEDDLAAIVEQRVELLKEFPLDTMREEVEALLSRYASDVARQYAARNELETARARLSALESELAKRQATYTLESSLSPESLVIGSSAGLSVRDVETLAGVVTYEETLNDAYVQLDSAMAMQEVHVRTLESELAVLETSTAIAQPELVAKQAAIQQAEAMLAQLDTKFDALKSNRSELSSKLLDAEVALADTLAPIRVLDEPLVPEGPIAPKKATNIAIAGFSGTDGRDIAGVPRGLPRAGPRTGTSGPFAGRPCLRTTSRPGLQSEGPSPKRRQGG